MQVAIALPVEKSRACRTAITPAIRDHTDAANDINPPRKGMNEKNRNIPGEFEKPIVRSNSPHVAEVSAALKTFVPIM